MFGIVHKVLDDLRHPLNQYLRREHPSLSGLVHLADDPVISKRMIVITYIIINKYACEVIDILIYCFLLLLIS